MKRKPEKYKRRYGNQFKRSWNDSAIERIADDMLDWFKLPEHLWLKDFAIEKMINAQRFDEWSKRNEYFRYILGLCKDMQESKLLRMGLNKKINAGMPIFALKNVAGWRDKQEVTVQTFDPSKCTLEQLERIRNGEDPNIVLQQNSN